MNLDLSLSSYSLSPQDKEHGEAENDDKLSVQTGKTSWSRTAFLLVGLVILLLVNILFIADTELTLRRNEAYQGNEEREWGFGQILALLLLFIPLRDAWIALRNIENSNQQQLEQTFRAAAEAGTRLKLLEKLGSMHKIDFKRFHNGLQYAAYHGSIDLIKFAHGYGLSLDIEGEPDICLLD